jgi:hypothetical protein
MENFGSMMGPAPGRVRVLNSHAVLEKLKNRPLALILQGHVHTNERLDLAGIPCITGGAVCGKWWRGPNGTTAPGVGLIEIHPAASSGPSNSSAGGVGWSYLETPTPITPALVT